VKYAYKFVVDDADGTVITTFHVLARDAKEAMLMANEHYERNLETDENYMHGPVEIIDLIQ